MIRRFQIEDLVVQDATGVVFRAHDSETDRAVAIRRFFPFGIDGGGLHAEEQTAYEIAVGRLARIHHPAMRSVVSGGCDPVDGMPFIVTEWVEGEALDVVMDGETLPVEAATLLISQALEVSELLSHVLAEEAVWVETDLNTVVVSHKESGRGFTFWISPLKWLGPGENRGLESIITLAEEAMGWQGRIVNEQAGRGLGAWIKWLRAAAATTSLHEAREMLAASVGAEPPPPAKSLVARASKPLRPVKQASSKAPLFVTLALILAAGAGVAWFLSRNSQPETAVRTASAVPAAPKAATPPAPSPAPEPLKPAPAETAPVTPPTPEPSPVKAPVVQVPAHVPDEVELFDRRLKKINAENEEAAKAERKTAAYLLKRQQAEVDANGGVYFPRHHELLIAQEDKVATVEGVVRSIDFSGNRHWMYLVLDDAGDKLFARGKIILAKAPPELGEEAMKPLVGRKVRLRGTVERQSVGRAKRPLVLLKTPESLEVLP